MRDERYTRGLDSQPGQGYAADQYGYPSQGGYGEPPAGFNRHQSGNARRVAAENPVVGAFKRIGGAVSGLAAGRRQQVASSARPSRAAAMGEGGDYLGMGEPCRVCGNPVEAEQARCPHCGAFVKPLYTQVPFWIAVAVLVVLVVLLTLAINSCKPLPSGDDQQGGTPDSAQSSTRTSALEAAILSAQNTYDTQSANHTSTRYSLSALQSAITSADAVLDNKDATDEEIANAAQSVSDAMVGLVTTVGVTYPWPWYFEEIMADVARWTGSQLAINGVCQVLTVNPDGTYTATMAVSGDSNCLVYVTYAPADVEPGAQVLVGTEFDAYGVMTGLTNGVPALLADYVDVV